MSLLTAGALAGLLLAIPIVLLHLRRGQPPVLEVASLLTWRELAGSAPVRRSALRRPLVPLLLLLQLVALTAFVVALARPVEFPASPPGRIYVLDDSLWMGAADGPSTPMELARRELRSELAGVPEATRVSIVLAGTTPSLLFSGSPSGAARAIEGVRPTDDSSNLDGAVRLAAGLRRRAFDRILLLRAPEDRPPQVQAGPGVFSDTVIGKRVSDQGLSGAVARCGLPAPTACQVFARVLNTGPAAVRDRIELYSDGQAAGSVSVTVPAGSSSPLDLPARAGAAVEMKLAGTDALAADDTAFASVPGTVSVKVTLVGQPAEARGLAAALASVPGVTLRLRTPADYRPSEAARTDLLLIDGASPAGGTGGAPSVVLLAPETLVGAKVDGALPDSRLSGLDSTGTLLEGVDLSSLTIDTGAARRLHLPSWMRALVWSPEGPLLAAGATGGRRTAVVSFQPADSNITQLASFPILVSNMTAWSQEWAPSQVQAGGQALIEDPPGTTAVTVRDLAGRSRALPAQPGGSQELALHQPGIYTISQFGAWGVRRRSITVNVLGSPAASGPALPIAGPAGGVPARKGLSAWLLGLALAALLLEWAYALTRTRGRRAGRRSELDPRRLPVVLRYASLVALVLALVDVGLAGRPAGVVLVIDRSASIGRPAAAEEEAWLTGAAHGDCPGGCEAVQFAGAARITSPAAGLLAARGGGSLEGQETDLQGALELALGRAGQGGRLVLMSDGLQSRGEAGSLVAEARSRGVKIDVVPLARGGPDAAVSRLHAPAALHAGDPLSLEATIDTTSGPAKARVTLIQDGSAVASQRLELTKGETPLLFSLRAPAAGWHSYELRVTQSPDATPENDGLSASVRVTAEPRVLLVGSNTAVGGILEADGMSVRRLAPSELPAGAAGYAGTDAVVLDDVPASELEDGRGAALAAAVHGGLTGLLVLGGTHSFSLGGYAGSDLEAALPVASLEPGSLRQRHVAVEIVLDRSGSMINEAGGVPKLEMAQAASAASARFLAREHDQLGIVDFDIKAHVLVPLRSLVPGEVAGIDRSIEGLTAEGGTDLYTALTEGARQIEASREPVRRIILITDGVSEPGSYAALLPALRRGRITVSTVALGSEADFTLLRAIAHATGGNYYAAEDAAELPRIFEQETHLKARPVSTRGRIAVSAGASSPVVASLAGTSLPALPSNVVTSLRSGAQADLLGADPGHEPDPLLAQWQYGLGRVVTWTPGLSPALAGAWTKRTQLWQDAVRWAERGSSQLALTPESVVSSPGELQIDTVKNAGLALDGAELGGSIETPGSPAASLHFVQSAPGVYGASVQGLEAGLHRYSISGHGSTAGVLAVPYGGEYLPKPAEATGLGALAAATGGQVLNASRRSSIERQPLATWWWLGLVALACFFTGAALRLIEGSRGERYSVAPSATANWAAEA